MAACCLGNPGGFNIQQLRTATWNAGDLAGTLRCALSESQAFYQRPPLLRRSPPALATSSGLGRASLRFNLRPLNSVPFREAMALSASAAFAISTNANPRGWPE